MRILFNMMCTVEIPDADVFPPKEEVKKRLIEMFKEEMGANLHGLEITNYAVPAEEDNE